MLPNEIQYVQNNRTSLLAQYIARTATKELPGALSLLAILKLHTATNREEMSNKPI